MLEKILFFKKKKSIWKKLYNHFKSWSWFKKIIIIVIIFLFFSFLVNLVSFDQGRTALLELRESYQPRFVCHEKCWQERKEGEQVIVESWDSLEGEILKYWYSEKENVEFKKELVRLRREYKEEIPDYFLEYLNDSESDINLQVEIVKNFSLSPETKKYIINLWEEKGEDNLEAIRALGMMMNKEIFNWYIQMLKQGISEEKKKEIIKEISMVRDKRRYFNKEDVSFFYSLLVNSNNKGFKQDVLFLLFDYYHYFPQSTLPLLEQIEKENKVEGENREILRDFLQRYRE